MITKYFYLILAMFLWNCQSDSDLLNETAATKTSAEGIPFKQEFSIKMGEQVILTGGEAPRKLHLWLKELNDSRCPANATCVHYGAASILLSASNSQGKNDTIEMCIGGCYNQEPRNTHTITTQIGQVTYKITLKEIRPFPGLEQDADTKQAVLQVEKL
ncbi:hypothetical protein ACMA1I_22025 [Pontibacter sp. 13R65]|uniref:hypothetical protein n=1 Tax=Pontibacter sp. 13R65 TaxID=3127458 RepID=UPI00301B7A1C